MDKYSYYNVVVDYQGYKLVYNTLTNALVCLTSDEFGFISGYRDNLELFCLDYPTLYDSFKKCGFIVDADFNELDYIKFMNHKAVYDDQLHHIIINPTLDCNLRCWYCATELVKAVHQGRMDDATVDAVKKYIADLVNVKRVPGLFLDWFGGEPLMYFDDVILPIGEYASKLAEESNIRFEQHITTNSVFMTEDMIKRMARLHFNGFQITLDGNERRHNLIKFKADKSGTFQTIVGNINLLPEIIPDVRINLRINYDKKTLSCIEDVIPLISENAKAHIAVDFQKVWQIRCDNKDNEQLEKVRAAFKSNGFFLNYSLYKPKAFHRCYADRLHQYIINYDGRVFKCTAQDYGDDKVVGELGKDGKIVWNYKRLSSLLAHSTFEDEKCYKCKLLPICMGPCMSKCKTARDKGLPHPCVNDGSMTSANEYIINEALVRKLI